MKAIATLKPPAKNKGRFVVCGNYAMARENEELAMLQVDATHWRFELWLRSLWRRNGP